MNDFLFLVLIPKKDGGQFWKDLTDEVEGLHFENKGIGYYKYKNKSAEKNYRTPSMNVRYCEKGERIDLNSCTFIDPKNNNEILKDNISEAIRYEVGKEEYWKIKKTNGNSQLYFPNELKVISKGERVDINSYTFIDPKYNNEINNISEAIRYKNGKEIYWRIKKTNGSSKLYFPNDLIDISPCIDGFDKNNAFDYFKQAASLSVIPTNSENGEISLRQNYDKNSYVPEYSVLASYLYPEKYKAKRNIIHQPCIFPFGSNGSQLKAVNAAFENQISVIQGPPGTGKTQTILNIIANILIQGKTVLVVSGNNSAIQNVVDKLKKSGFDYLNAKLGNRDNCENFLRSQSDKSVPPEISGWNKEAMSLDEIDHISSQLKHVFDNNETIAQIDQNLLELDTEEKHFQTNHKDDIDESLIKPNLSSEQLSTIFTVLPKVLYGKKNHIFSRLKNLIFLFKCRFIYGINKEVLCPERVNAIVFAAQSLYYKVRRNELLSEKNKCVEENKKVDANGLLRTLTDSSMDYLKQYLNKTSKHLNRIVYSDYSELKSEKNALSIVHQYPIILSTAFSARFLKNVEYDYVIMDEASQVSITQGALSLSIGKNVVIVGDLKQLPTVISNDIKPKLERLFPDTLNEYYDCSKYSFLESVVHILDGQIGSTLLREHYRCHPKIINFCNKEFYHGELVIMSKDNENSTPLHVIRSVAGNHARGTVNLREAQIISDEVIDKLAGKDVGIVAAYRDQVATIENLLQAKSRITKVDTVHKFQGQENDVIIMDYVADKPNDFVDDPCLMNVAISRAKEELYLVVTGNELPKDRIISDLVDYIEYNCGEIIESKIHSIFDILYTHLDEVYEKQMKKESVESPAEILMLQLVRDRILKEPEFEQLAVHTNYSLKNIFGKDSLMTDEERSFVRNTMSHTDLLIFNKLTNKPILAIETDGYQFHYAETANEQKERDLKKNSIFKKNGIPLLRCSTTDSREEEKITTLLHEILSTNADKKSNCREFDRF